MGMKARPGRHAHSFELTRQGKAVYYRCAVDGCAELRLRDEGPPRFRRRPAVAIGGDDA